MNDNHVHQIFAHYIDQFERVNNTEHREYYKWQIIKRFHDEMDAALKAPAEELPAKLYADDGEDIFARQTRVSDSLQQKC